MFTCMRGDVVECKEELEVVFVDAPAIFRASVGHDPQHRQVVFLMERRHPVIEQIGVLVVQGLAWARPMAS